MRGVTCFGLGALSLVAACTIVNTFDPVDTPPADGGGVEASVPETSVVDSAVPEAAVAPLRGVIVVGGAIETASSSVLVLTALDPRDGHELPRAREPMKVAAVLYDSIRDLFYIFESGGDGFIPAPTDPVFLHVRAIDAEDGHWTEHAKLQVPANLSFSTMAVVRDRIGYVAYRPEDAGDPLAYDFVTIDTSSATKLTLLDTLPLKKQPIGAIGTPSSTGAGGIINLLQRSACDGGACVEMVRVLLPPGAAALATTVVPAPNGTDFVPYGGGPTFAHHRGSGLDIIGSRGATSPATMYFFQPQNSLAASAPVNFDIAGSGIRPLAVAECQRTLLAVETNTDLLVHAIPLTAGGTAATIATNHSGQGVYFDPYTNTVLAPFSQGPGYDLTAFTLGGTDKAPALVHRGAPGWAPPASLRPQLIATRAPATFPCP